MKHCCVIGGAGFIGTYVVGALVGLKRRVTVIDKGPTPSGSLPEGVRYVKGDYGREDLLREVLKGADEVVHLAYSTFPKTSFENPVNDILENLPATVRLLEAASSVGVTKFVLVSSGGTVYGKAHEIPIREDHPTNPISPYGITKLATEKYAMMYHELNGLPVVCVRPGNAYGEGQRPFVGQGFIATAIASVLKRKEIVLFGESGTVRDYIHVRDIASGIVAALERGRPGSCYNIGSGVGRSNRDILDAIYPLAKSAGLELAVKVLPSRRFDVPANVLDSTRLAKETGWKESVSFEDGIEGMWSRLAREMTGQQIVKKG